MHNGPPPFTYDRIDVRETGRYGVLKDSGSSYAHASACDQRSGHHAAHDACHVQRAESRQEARDNAPDGADTSRHKGVAGGYGANMDDSNANSTGANQRSSDGEDFAGALRVYGHIDPGKVRHCEAFECCVFCMLLVCGYMIHVHT
jgi:hypothetical protein